MQKHISLKNHQLNKSQLIIILSAIVIFALITVFSISTLIYRSGKIATVVKFAPYKATVTLNDKVVKNNSTIYLEPGEYHAVVEFEHFERYEQDFTVSESLHNIFGILTASDEEGIAYAEKYRNQFATVEGYIGTVLNKQGEELQKKYPIVSYLPITNSLYSITYMRETPDSEPVITVKAEDDVLDAAVARLKSFKDVDILDLNLEFYTEFSTEYSTSFAQDPLTFTQEAIPDAKNHQIASPIELSDDYTLIKMHSHNANYGRGANYGYYRVLLRKTDDGYELASKVAPLLTRRSAPDVPDDIIRAANDK